MKELVHFFEAGIRTRCNKRAHPLRITQFWGMVTCPECLSFSPSFEEAEPGFAKMNSGAMRATALSEHVAQHHPPANASGALEAVANAARVVTKRAVIVSGPLKGYWHRAHKREDWNLLADTLYALDGGDTARCVCPNCGQPHAPKLRGGEAGANLQENIIWPYQPTN